MRKNFLKSTKVFIIALLLVCTSVLGSQTYNFTLRYDEGWSRSAPYTKYIAANSAYIRVSGSSNSSITTSYAVFDASGTLISEITNIVNGDIGVNGIEYTSTGQNAAGTTKLGARTSSTADYYVTGEWNPNG